VTLCAVRTVHRRIGSVSPGLASKMVATVSLSLASKPVARVSPLGVKTGSYGFVIYAVKSPRQFHGLGLKTRQATVCWLRHKIDGRATT
jgi:hypothetical protein